MIFGQFSTMRQKKVKFFNFESNDQIHYADWIFNEYIYVTALISIIYIFVCYGVIENKYYLICFPRELSQASAGMVM